MSSEMKELIMSWGLPQIEELRDGEVSFVFDSSELKVSHRLCQDLHCRDGSVCFCLYDAKTDDVVFVLNFFVGGIIFNRSPYIKLDTIAIVDPTLRIKGIAAFYLNKLREYAESKNIRLIKIHADANNKAFKLLNKDKILPNQKLKEFYLKYLQTETIRIEFV